MSNNIVPVIMCGGTGSRLWPLSRESFPKQYLSITKNSKYTLLQKTLKRILSIQKISKPILICNEEHRFIVLDQLDQIGVIPEDIILEPCGKNTAPAIAIAALKIENNEDILLVLAADHEIKNEDKFLEAIEVAKKSAENDLLVTFGVVPTHPETGYGYIEVENQFKTEVLQSIPIKSFLEKPNKEKALKFISQKRFLWNSGMFLFKAKIIIEEIQKFNPNLLELCKKSLVNSKNDLAFLRLEESNFTKCPNISIDVAIMEKTKSSVVIPLDVGWSDIGSWGSIWEIEKKDEANNVSLGQTLIQDGKNCYLRSSSRLLVGLGIRNLIVIETSDAVLIADKGKDQEVKNVIKELKNRNFDEGTTHREIFRPWGGFLSISQGDNWQVKKIEVKVGASLSLQLHKHRSEHWVVVNGEAFVEIDEKKFILKKNESTYIPKNSKHRLSNKGNVPLILIEVQSGEYLGEDDIIRFEDYYGR